MTINAKVQQKFEIQHSFPLEALENQVRESIISQFGNELASKVKYTTELVDDAVVVTAYLGEPSSTNTPIKKRTRRTKAEMMAAKREEEESSEIPEITVEEEEESTEDTVEDKVDLSNNKEIAPTEATKILIAAGIEPDSDSLPNTKELTLEQYKLLKDDMAKAKTMDYDKVASVLAFESQHPDLVIKALYGDNPPKPVINTEAKSLNDKVSKEEQEYINYFSWSEKVKGHKVRIPYVDTPVVDDVRVAPRRYVEVQSKEGTVLAKYLKYPDKADLVDVTNTLATEDTSWE